MAQIKVDSITNTAGTGPAALTNGSLVPYVAKSANYTLLSTDEVVPFTTSTSALTATLPTAVGTTGKCYTISKVDSATGTVTINTTSSQTIGGLSSGSIVLSEINASVTIVSDGSNWQFRNKFIKAPTIQRFTTAGAASYTTPAGVLYIKVKMVGGGGGGGSSGTASRNAGNNGTDSLFGSILTAGHGNGGSSGGTGGSGGTNTVNSPAVKLQDLPGENGGYVSERSNVGSGNGAETLVLPGGYGGRSFLAGAGEAKAGAAGGAAKANSGSGGAGGGFTGLSTANLDYFGGASGGAGAYLEAVVANPSSSYSLTIGTKGTGGGAGTNGFAGGDGADGLIVVEEYYN